MLIWLMTHASSVNPSIRAIVDADDIADKDMKTVRFSLKSHKVFLFNKETEERIRF